MKRSLLLLVAVGMFVSCTTEDSPTALDLHPSFQVPGDPLCVAVTLGSQAEVEAFSCSEVTGGLTIQGNDIIDLSPLSILTSVDGLVIRNNAALTSLNGLSGFTSTGSLYIWDNRVLEDLNGLSALTSARILSIRGNDLLRTLDGLPALTSVEGGVGVSFNRSLTNIDGLSSVTSTGYVDIGGNEALTNVDGLSGLTMVGQLFVNQNPALTNLDGLSALTQAWYLMIVGNDALMNVDGLSALAAAGAVIIEENGALTNLDGLSGLEMVYGGFSLRENPVLCDCATGLYNILQTPGFVYYPRIADNAPGCNSPEEILIVGLTKILEDLGLVGMLNEGQVTSLVAKMQVLQKALEGDRASAAKVLDAFVKEVEGLEGGGVLPSEQAQPLIHGASAITWYM